jgi:hypothetical protein
MEDEKGLNKPIKLSSQNYLIWSQKLQNYLGEKKLTRYIEFDNFNDFWATRTISDQEARYRRRIQAANTDNDK